MKTISFLFIIFSFINGAVTESVKVNLGFSVTLHTNTVIQSNDVIEWRFRKEPLAKVDRGSISVFNGSDGTFSDGLKINNQTGDLTVTDISIYTIGEYHLQITGEKSTTKSFSVSGLFGFTADVTSLSVMEGDSVSLDAGAPDNRNYDVIRWRFGNSPLAELDRKTKIISTHDDVHDERFTGRLELDNESGDLTIANITTDLSGLYEVIVDSNSGTHTIHQSYTVTVSGEYIKSFSMINIRYT
ncbi:uncharacterized protein LOC130548658 [Triplophysa rosa]|uniref:uncharacterized protein LOC130548658 n=1 Tax=Triplophysa rosa TaxID=992332 RepID=UPI0025460CE6|nr:uncharacterized protein LOC130548658 [Triplophysa rosa]